ncbi:hypothetical protein BUE80_DR008241 [Diplocarpon rosae]|nr:hypothetical protein BUE80_DR008241 [Diplocarpon rosae]
MSAFSAQLRGGGPPQARLPPPTPTQGFDRMSRFLLREIEKEVLPKRWIEIQGDVSYQYFAIGFNVNRLATGPNKYTGKGSKMLHGPMLMDTRQEIAGSQVLVDVMEHLEAASQSMDGDSRLKPRVDKLLSYWTGACSLKQLDRFCDKAYPPFTEYPDANGANFSDPTVNPYGASSLFKERNLRAMVIRLLHYRGLSFPDATKSAGAIDSRRLLNLVQLYLCARGLLDLELDGVVPMPPTDENFRLNKADEDHDKMRFLQSSRRRIRDTLLRVAGVATRRLDDRPAFLRLQERLAARAARAAAGLEPLTAAEEDAEEERIFQATLPPDNLTAAERLDANVRIRGVAFLDDLIEVRSDLKPLSNDPTNHLDPLLLDLAIREDAFERALAVEHYEDKLISKQVSIIDEQRTAISQRWLPNWSIEFFNSFDSGSRFGDQHKMVYKTLNDMSLVNRHRRGFRLLRDWVGRRPWVEEGIKAFHMKTIHALRGSLAPPSRNPSSYRHLLPRLFGIIPITAPNLVNATNFPNCIGSTSWKECGICKTAMASGKGIDSTIMELRCSPVGHVFHIRCIFQHWDAPGQLLHSCPTCGHMAQLNWETVGLVPFDYVDFAHNNQAYHLSSVVAPYLSDPDPIKRAAARKLYNVPGDITDDFDPVNPETASLPYFTRAYYTRENNLRLAKENMDIFWRPALFPAGRTTSLPREVRDLSIRSDNTLLQSIYDLALSPLQRARNARAKFLGSVDALAKRMGRDFLRLASERQDRAVQEAIARGETVTEQDVYDMSEVRILPTARMAPEVEAWQFRSARRRRDAQQRRKIKLARRGLAGLGG